MKCFYLFLSQKLDESSPKDIMKEVSRTHLAIQWVA